MNMFYQFGNENLYKHHVRPSSIYYWNGSEKWDLSGNWFGSKWRLHWTLFQFDGLEYYEAKKCDSIVIKVGGFSCLEFIRSHSIFKSINATFFSIENWKVWYRWKEEIQLFHMERSRKKLPAKTENFGLRVVAP